MNEQVRKLLNGQLWFLGTFSDEPNAVPVFFKHVNEDGTLTVGDVFLGKTLKNVLANEKISVSVCDSVTHEGYQIKGTAKYISEGPVVEEYKETVSKFFKGAKTAKGALIITPEKIYVTTPGAENNKTL